MKNITKILSEEHQIILKVTEVVLSECNMLEKGKETDTDFFEKVLFFIKQYADAFHHAKEEKILFPEMLSSMENMHCNPVPVMLQEHDNGREFVMGMEAAMKTGDKRALIQNATGYSYLLQTHIYKEDNILYPMAEEALNAEAKERVSSAYASVHQADFFPEDTGMFISKLAGNKGGQVW